MPGTDIALRVGKKNIISSWFNFTSTPKAHGCLKAEIKLFIEYGLVTTGVVEVIKLSKLLQPAKDDILNYEKVKNLLLILCIKKRRILKSFLMITGNSVFSMEFYRIYCFCVAGF